MSPDEEDDDDLSEATLSGDIRRERWPADDAPRINAYLGNGRFGGCFDAYGLQNNGWNGRTQGLGETVLLHAEHRRETPAGLEYLPLARWVWAGDAPLDGAPAPAYEQALRLNHGWLFTEMSWGGLDLAVVAHFHPRQRDLCVLSIDAETSGGKSVPPLLLAPAGPFEILDLNEKKGLARVRVREGETATDLALRVVSEEGRAKLQRDGAGVKVSFSGRAGRHLFLLGASAAARGDEMAAGVAGIGATDELLREGVSAWQEYWSGWGVELGDPEHQALYERSLYMLLCSSDGATPFPAHGWTGNGELRPNPATLAEAQGIFHMLGLDALVQGGAALGGIAARNIDEFLALAKTDAEQVQFFDAQGAPYSLAAHAVFINTVHATLLGDYNGAQSQSWPLSWSEAAFENLGVSDSQRASARRDSGGAWGELA